jgi:hypothetical protein
MIQFVRRSLNNEIQVTFCIYELTERLIPALPNSLDKGQTAPIADIHKTRTNAKKSPSTPRTLEIILSGVMMFPSPVVTPLVLDGLALASLVPAACVELAVVDVAVTEGVEPPEGAGDMFRPIVVDPMLGWEVAGVTYQQRLS